MVPLTISKRTLRQLILGKQGLYPGRRWQGKTGAAQALRAGCVVQMDPLSVVAHNQDIVLYGRVLDYRPADLDALLYTDRLCFEFGGAVMLHPYRRTALLARGHGAQTGGTAPGAICDRTCGGRGDGPPGDP